MEGKGVGCRSRVHTEELLRTSVELSRKKDVRRWGTHLSLAGEFWSTGISRRLEEGGASKEARNQACTSL